MLNLDNADADGNADELETLPQLPLPPPQPEEESLRLLAEQRKRTDAAIKPPYTAPLAPYDMELLQRVGLKGKLVAEDSIWGAGEGKRRLREARGAAAAARFVELERRGDAGKASNSSSESLSLHEKRARFAESSSTLKLPDTAGQLPNGKASQHRSTNLNQSTPLLPMTEATLVASSYDDRECSCPREFYQRAELNTSLFFEDCTRSIDFVLAHTINAHEPTEAENAEKRRVFQENLVQQGLEVELSQKDQIYFVKIHAPLEVLRRYAEILKLRMPMKESLCNLRVSERSNRLHNAAHYLSKKIPGLSVVNRSTKSVYSSLKTVCQFFLRNIYVDEQYFPRRAHRFTAIYSRDKEYLFDIRQDCFFTTAVRSRIVEFILDRQRFPAKRHSDMAFGIERLVAEGVYCAAYPLHDGEINEKGTMRELLYTNWASVKKWYRYQPLDDIKEYFGVKIGLYFAWLGYYTYMLLLASIVGVACFLYSWISLKNYVPVKDICLRSNSNITMCPLCDWCEFWNLKETCNYAKITYLIDNPSTVFFAVFMSFWATLFLELWKRYSAEITHRWDLTGFDVHEEHPRPQYLARLEHIEPTRTDYVTNMKEPTVPFWRMKLPATVFSFSVVVLLIALAFVALVAVVVHRMSMLAALKVDGSGMTTSKAIVLAAASAAFVNLCLLYVLNYLYNHLAEYLTELEMWRTQTQFDDSLTLKIYLLQFVNYYASIFYIAFFKGKFVGHPGEYITVFKYRQEECSSGGCLTELCIQLAIIMIGKQAFNTILEVYLPMFWRKVLAIQVGLSRLFRNAVKPDKTKDERWMRDFKLLDWGARSLFPEYLEMVLQYGFVTIFVAAFPLAPFFALLNNILEMRLDAKKLLTHHKRPVSQRVRDIGVWYRILDCIGKLSVITNGFIIAFTSDMIPRLVYRSLKSPDGTLNGYLDFTLSEFRISDSSKLQSLAGDFSNITTCKYTDYREPPTSPEKYHLTSMYYIILACRLGFVVVFENFVALVMILVRWCIPDMSVELRDQIRREVYITNEIIIDQEAQRARFERAKRNYSVVQNPSEQDVDAASVDEPNTKFIQIEKLLTANLSQIEMDSILHRENSTTGISGADC
ncbi:anoctamin-1 isoform X2 [Drosophila novamexicana]|uniref:anoctamin-1 isoform X2 n=1 Tax=Drosophila novamexicana TaxID=47314 RepID=UPI0011E5E954|nr:anoctamin-1 isoform X2 [Drosophila novamexicana]